MSHITRALAAPVGRQAEKVDPAVTRAVKKAIGRAEGRHVQALKGAIADAQQNMLRARSLNGP